MFLPPTLFMGSMKPWILKALIFPGFHLFLDWSELRADFIFNGGPLWPIGNSILEGNLTFLFPHLSPSPLNWVFYFLLLLASSHFFIFVNFLNMNPSLKKIRMP